MHVAGVGVLGMSPLAILPARAAASQPVQHLERIEPGVGDVGADVLSRRDLRTELRHPVGFDTVYRLNRTDAFGRQDDVFVRIGGGVTAVFPRSTYRPTGRGAQAEIPPGTVFHLGRLPEPLAQPGSRPPSPNRVSLAAPVGLIDLGVPTPGAPGTEQPSSAAQPAPEGEVRVAPSMFEDEDFRRRRIDALLGKAAKRTGLARGADAD